MRSIQVLKRAQLHLKVTRPVMTETRHVPGEAGHQVDLLRIYLEVDKELGLLRRAGAGKVPQTLIRPVRLTLNAVHAIIETEQCLVQCLRQFV